MAWAAKRSENLAGRSVYDCLYLALAVQTRSILATADKRLVHALADTPLAKHIAWIGNAR